MSGPTGPRPETIALPTDLARRLADDPRRWADDLATIVDGPSHEIGAPPTNTITIRNRTEL
ncbi:MAG: hypothetical protein ACR2QK_22390 [Acidimicrobiales bacterium]